MASPMPPLPTPKLRFLIADPLEGVQVFCRRLLEADGFEAGRIHCASSAIAAWELAQSAPPDFLLTDWFGQSSLTGVQLAERIRERNPAVRLGFLSFQVDAEVEAHAHRLRSRFVLKKPFDAEALRRTLQTAFAELGPTQPALMARVLPESQGRLDPRRRMELPPLPPPLKVGDAVQHAGRRHKVLAVVMSRGEQFAQLDGVRDLVPAYRLTR